MRRGVFLLGVVIVAAAAIAPPFWAAPGLAAARQSAGGPAGRRLTTLDALRVFAGFYHLQNVLIRGELVEDGPRLVLRADASEMRVLLGDGVRTEDGLIEARGQLVDVGRLEPGDPRLGNIGEGRDADRWPRPGEELLLRLSNVAEAPPAVTPSVRALALEPWKFAGQKVTLIGNFRGRNLFGDLPGAPGKSRYDFVLRGAEGAIWVTGLRPRGRGFDLDVDRRLDTDRWVEVTGTVAHERGLVILDATGITTATAPQITEAAEEPDAPSTPLIPVEVVFSSPTEGEAEVGGNAPVRIQFSRGLDEASLAGRIKVTLIGAPRAGGGAAEEPGATFKTSYDGATRALELRFGAPLPPFRTVRVEILDGVKGFDGAPVTPWTLTFSVGG